MVMHKIQGEYSTDHCFLFPRVKLWEVISNNHYNRPLWRCLSPINYEAHSGWQVLWTCVSLGDQCHSRNSLYVLTLGDTCECEAIPSQIPREDFQPIVTEFTFTQAKQHPSTNYPSWMYVLNRSSNQFIRLFCVWFGEIESIYMILCGDRDLNMSLIQCHDMYYMKRYLETFTWKVLSLPISKQHYTLNGYLHNMRIPLAKRTVDKGHPIISRFVVQLAYFTWLLHYVIVSSINGTWYWRVWRRCDVQNTHQLKYFITFLPHKASVSLVINIYIICTPPKLTCNVHLRMFGHYLFGAIMFTQFLNCMAHTYMPSIER